MEETLKYLKKLGAKFSPAKSHLFASQEEDGNGLSTGDVRGFMGNALKIQWASVSKHHFSAMEGRTNHPILGAPGGDLGIWLMGLAIYEARTQ